MEERGEERLERDEMEEREEMLEREDREERLEREERAERLEMEERDGRKKGLARQTGRQADSRQAGRQAGQVRKTKRKRPFGRVSDLNPRIGAKMQTGDRQADRQTGGAIRRRPGRHSGTL